jgi:hypothetical protein
MRWSRSSSALVLAALVVSSTASADALPPDDTPPEVSIESPADGLELPAGTTTITVEVTAEDPQTGIYEVELKVDGTKVATDDEAPFVFADVALTPGRHEIVASAHNNDGGHEDSTPVSVVVAEAAPEPTPEAKAEPEPEPEAKAEAEPAEVKSEAKADAKPPAAKPADAKDTPDAKDGCFASARPRSLAGSGVAFAIALFAGLTLRRRRS